MKSKTWILIIYFTALICISGCSFVRQTKVSTKIKNGRYGLAKGNGNAVYEAVTKFSFLQKGVK